MLLRMRPRWVDDDRSTRGDRVGHTIIAKWRPWVYYLVSTFHIDRKSPIQRIITSLDAAVPSGRAAVAADYFVTRVVRCSRYGVARADAEPLFEREYQTIEEAKSGHDEAVNIFKLK
jgi:hypothetical protein